MRLWIFFGLVLAPLTSMAAYYLKIETIDEGPRYQLIIKADDWVDDGQKSYITGITKHGTCEGYYSVDPETDIVTVEFDETSTGCSEESLTIDISNLNFWDIYWGEKALVIISSKSFSEAKRDAQIYIVPSPEE